MGTRIEIDFSNKGTFYNMPKYDSSGNIINYDIQAQYNRRHDYELAGYNKDWELDKIEKVSDYNFVIKYKLTEKSRTEGKAGNYNPKVDVSVKANWEGEYIDKNNLPDVYFKLMNGNKLLKDLQNLNMEKIL
ncbi:hypothetical protein [Peptoniphilus indolicus]|uniref:Uncharacterized protein n=1 Tax=Peptoniphilus indolicus TaxID=33030 RepID=A0A379EEX0_9FIRM|nr:hypothetical protein [Peptoniphilus indolicus]SUB94781.1 Uncharacterised protein [Peptoniphilus indolicus]